MVLYCDSRIPFFHHKRPNSGSICIVVYSLTSPSARRFGVLDCKLLSVLVGMIERNNVDVDWTRLGWADSIERRMEIGLWQSRQADSISWHI